MKTVTVPKRKLLFAALAIVALVGVACVIADIQADSGGGTAATATPEAGDAPALTEAETEAATAAAGHALGEVMRFDHAEGQDAWAERIEPLCTPNGLAFWTGPFFAGQVWPTVMERAYTTQAVDVVEAEVTGAGDAPGSVVVEVTLRIEYVLGEGGQPTREESTNRG